MPAKWYGLIAITLASPLAAQGGPPMITDDPDTPGPGHWEINLAFSRERTDSAISDGPIADFNFGVGRRIQLKLEAPWVRLTRSETGPVNGPGRAVAGVKWRFLGEEGRRIAWAVYPQYEFSTSASSAARGLVEPGHRWILPTEITLELPLIELNMEVGRTFSSAAPDSWLFGFSTEVTPMPRTELVAEIHGEHPTGFGTELLLNAGVREKVTCQITLMFAAGSAIAGESDRSRLLIYAGLQLNLPGLFHFSEPSGSITRIVCPKT